MDEREERDDETAEDRGEAPARDADAEQSDPESAPASEPPPGQEPGEGKQHDL